jgi:hypothetical protein
VKYNLSFAADPSYGFGFSPTNLWVNGASSTAVAGVSEISALFELVRVAKVEIIYLPGCKSLPWSDNTVTTGTRNIPWVYEGFDPHVSTTPTVAGLLEQGNVVIRSADDMFRKTIYPVLLDDAGVVPTAVVNKHTFICTGVDTPANGWNFIADLDSVALTYDIGVIFFKIFYECKNVR